MNDVLRRSVAARGASEELRKRCLLARYRAYALWLDLEAGALHRGVAHHLTETVRRSRPC